MHQLAPVPSPDWRRRRPCP